MGNQTLWAYIFISPTLLFLLVFAIIPIFFSFWVSLHNWNLITPIPEMPFVGLDNYTHVLTKDDVFRRALRNTVVFAFWGVFFNVGVGLLGALC